MAALRCLGQMTLKHSAARLTCSPVKSVTTTSPAAWLPRQYLVSHTWRIAKPAPPVTHRFASQSTNKHLMLTQRRMTRSYHFSAPSLRVIWLRLGNSVLSIYDVSKKNLLLVLQHLRRIWLKYDIGHRFMIRAVDDLSRIFACTTVGYICYVCVSFCERVVVTWHRFLDMWSRLEDGSGEDPLTFSQKAVMLMKDLKPVWEIFKDEDPKAISEDENPKAISFDERIFQLLNDSSRQNAEIAKLKEEVKDRDKQIVSLEAHLAEVMGWTAGMIYMLCAKGKGCYDWSVFYPKTADLRDARKAEVAKKEQEEPNDIDSAERTETEDGIKEQDKGAQGH